MLWQKICALPKIVKSTNKYNENLVRHRGQLLGNFFSMTEWDTISTLYNIFGLLTTIKSQLMLVFKHWGSISYLDSFEFVILEMGKWYLLILSRNEMPLSNLQKYIFKYLIKIYTFIRAKPYLNLYKFFCLENHQIKKYILKEWNVTPLIRRGSNFYFFAVLYFALLDLLP